MGFKKLRHARSQITQVDIEQDYSRLNGPAVKILQQSLSVVHWNAGPIVKRHEPEKVGVRAKNATATVTVHHGVLRRSIGQYVSHLIEFRIVAWRVVRI